MLPVATMVNSHTDEAMADRMDRLEKKVDDLAASIDRRFEAVDSAFLEQRQYTEFAFGKLEAKMDAGFASVETRMNAGFAGIDSRFMRLEHTLDDFIKQQGEASEAQRQMNDAQRHANQLVERRLAGLEQRPG